MLLPESRREKVNGFSRMRAFSLKDIYQIRIGVDAVELYSNKQTLNDSYVFCSDLTPTGEVQQKSQFFLLMGIGRRARSRSIVSSGSFGS